MEIKRSDDFESGVLLALLAMRTKGLERGRFVELVKESGGVGQLTPADLAGAGFREISAQFDSPEIRAQLRADLARWRRDGIEAIPLDTPRYPELLGPISDPPLLLFALGEIESGIFEKPSIGIVGSRRGDALGCSFAGEVAAEFARRGGCVVSGLAVGIDGAAHRGALAGCEYASTIAVLGAGFYSIYPAMHRALAREIASGGGLLVSQFEPEAKPFPANFLNRNRVIAGLSLGVLVVEAAARSGALVTARCALDSGRELLVVPGGIRDPLFEGSHKLLRDGAVPITACADLFESFPVSLPPVGEPRSSAPLTPGQLKVREFLRSGAPVSVTELFRTVGGEIHTEILALELCGAVVRLPGDLIQWVGEGS